MNLTIEDKQQIKQFCQDWQASRLWIDGVEVNVPEDTNDTRN